MKYSIFFAATAAAYDAYGGYGAQQSSSAPAKVSSAPSYGGYGGQSSSVPSKDYPVTSVKNSVPASKATPCLTTITPGYGKPPVTVTQQHQSYPTCVAKGYDGKSCDKWEDDKYVSTVVTDYNKKVQTVTKVQDYVTVYQEKKTITHYATPTIGGYGAVSTPGAKNSTGVWYELYEKIILCKYAECGKNVLIGYTGSGLCQKCDDEQPVTQKEYKGGKWTEEKKIQNYGKPKDEVKVYEKPGVYTVPAKVVTVYKSQATGSNKPSYDAGIYHIPAKVITITKANQPYTCTYDLPMKTPSKGDDKPMTKTPTMNDYGYKSSATPTPKKPSNDYPGVPSWPRTNSTSVHKPSSTPCDEDKKKGTPTPPVCYGDNCPCYGENCKKTSSMPSKPTPPPCNGDNCPCYGDNCKKTSSMPSKPTPPPCNGDNCPCYGDNCKKTSSMPSKSTPPACYGDNCPCYGENCKKTSSMPSKPTPPPCYGDNCPCYGDDCKKTSTAPSKPSSTPCDDDKKKATPTPYNNGGNNGGSYNNGNNGGNYGEAAKPTPTPVYNNGNNNGGNYGGEPPKPTPTPVYNNGNNNNNNNNGGSYGGVPSKPTYGKRAGAMERRMAAVEAQNL